jgi:hypothetical protein
MALTGSIIGCDSTMITSACSAVEPFKPLFLKLIRVTPLVTLHVQSTRLLTMSNSVRQNADDQVSLVA